MFTIQVQILRLKLSSLMLCLAVSLAISAPQLAVAQQTANKPIDKSQAAKKAQQQVKGRVLKVDRTKNKYRVKVLQKSGRVVSVDVDKKSGKVSKKKK